MSALPPHANVLRLVGACLMPPAVALVTPFCPRGSLYGILHSPEVQLSWAQVAHLCLGAAKGMQHLHSHSCLHRDLKSGELVASCAGHAGWLMWLRNMVTLSQPLMQTALLASAMQDSMRQHQAQLHKVNTPTKVPRSCPVLSFFPTIAFSYSHPVISSSTAPAPCKVLRKICLLLDRDAGVCRQPACRCQLDHPGGRLRPQQGDGDGCDTDGRPGHVPVDGAGDLGSAALLAEG